MLLKGEKVLPFLVKEAEAAPASATEEIDKLKAELQSRLEQLQSKLDNAVKSLESLFNQLKA